MIFTDFGPNESLDDALISLKLIFQPWCWHKEKEIKKAGENLINLLGLDKNKFKIKFFLSGRSALYNLLKSLNLKKGDEILVQGFTCEAVILPIIKLNLKPVYVDIEKDSFSMNLIDLKKKISKKTKIIILQHTFGIKPKYRNAIIKFIKDNNLLLIEDIAHTINISNIENFQLKENHFYLLSFGRSKSISSVFGGAIIGKNKILMKNLDKIKLKKPSYSFIIKCLLYKPIVLITKLTYSIYIGRLIYKISRLTKIIIPEISKKEKKGFFDESLNKAYPNALAILLIHQINKIITKNKRRKKIVNLYEENFNFKKKSISLKNQSLIRYPLIVKNPNKIIEKMKNKNIFLGRWYSSPVAPEEIPLNRVGYKIGLCPQAEDICQKIINLPVNISEKQAKKIIKNILFYN